jgi:hypothetical protein
MRMIRTTVSRADPKNARQVAKPRGVIPAS